MEQTKTIARSRDRSSLMSVTQIEFSKMDPLIDTHCHLDFESFDDDRDEVVNRATEVGVRRIIVPAIDLDGCQRVLALTERYNNVFAAIGVHPNSASGWKDEWIDKLRKLAIHDKGNSHWGDWSGLLPRSHTQISSTTGFLRSGKSSS